MAKNRQYESMTKVVLSSDFIVRVWCAENSIEDDGPRAAVYAALAPFRGFMRPVLPGTSVAGGHNWRTVAHQVAAALDLVKDVAAYEILDAAGNGIVVYTDWP